MGISTDLMQQMNRTFTSQKAEKDFRKKQKADFENYLYNRFYQKFYNEKDFEPLATYSYFINTEKKQEILQDFQDIDIITKSTIYNKILNMIYKDFQNDYKTNKSTEKFDKEYQKALKELEQAIKRRDRAKARYEKSLTRYRTQKMNIVKITKKGFGQILLGIFIGGRVASKTYRKMKY